MIFRFIYPRFLFQISREWDIIDRIDGYFLNHIYIYIDIDIYIYIFFFEDDIYFLILYIYIEYRF